MFWISRFVLVMVVVFRIKLWSFYLKFWVQCSNSTSFLIVGLSVLTNPYRPSLLARRCRTFWLLTWSFCPVGSCGGVLLSPLASTQKACQVSVVCSPNLVIPVELILVITIKSYVNLEMTVKTVGSTLSWMLWKRRDKSAKRKKRMLN